MFCICNPYWLHGYVFFTHQTMLLVLFKVKSLYLMVLSIFFDMFPMMLNPSKLVVELFLRYCCYFPPVTHILNLCNQSTCVLFSRMMLMSHINSFVTTILIKDTSGLIWICNTPWIEIDANAFFSEMRRRQQLVM